MKKIGKFFGFILCSILLFSVGILCTAKKASSIIIEKQKNIEKSQKMFSVLDVWLEKKMQGKSIANFIKKNNYHMVAIYGLGNIGRLLEIELRNYVEISYGIDRREIFAEFPVYKPEQDLPETDIVIVTAVYEFEEIEEMLRKKLNCTIYSIEDIVYFMD